MEFKNLIVPHLLRSWRPLLGGAVLGLVVVALSLVQSFFAGGLIESAQAGDSVAYPLLMVTVVATLSAVATGIQQLLLGVLTERSVAYWRRWFLRHFFFLPMLGRQSRSGGWFSSRLVTDPPLIGGFVGTRVVQAIQSGTALVASLVLLLWIDPVSTMVPVLLACLGVGSALLLAGPAGRMRTHIQEQNTLMSDGMETAVTATRLLIASNADDTQRSRISAYIETARREGVRLNAIYSVLGPITSTLMQVAYASVFVVGGWRVASGGLSFAEFITFLMLFSSFQESVQELSSVPGGISECRSAINHLYALRRFDGNRGAGEWTEDLGPSMVQVAPFSDGVIECPTQDVVPAAVTFSHVSFTYPGSDNPVLSDVSLTVPSQGLCVLVGPSGGGKSTCLGIVEGFFEADRGVINVLRCSLCASNLARLRSRIGYVDQDATIFSGTVLDNLVFGIADPPNEARMVEVLKETGLWALFSQNGGLNASVGRIGLSLSGGQRQRLAIARALLREPELLVLDEPTSNLDGMAEAQVRTLLKRISATRAVLMTAHRLSTILEADHVVVLQNGAVVDEGDHDALMSSCPYYRDLVFSQVPSSLSLVN